MSGFSELWAFSVTVNISEMLVTSLFLVAVTIPSGDITLVEGSPLEILCILSPSYVEQGFNASNLVFYRASVQVLSEFVDVVNQSTARLYIENPLPMRDMYYCKLTNGTDETPVCLNSVAVGRKLTFILNAE